MVREIRQGLDDNERRFLLPLVAGAPEWWSLLGIERRGGGWYREGISSIPLVMVFSM